MHDKYEEIAFKGIRRSRETDANHPYKYWLLCHSGVRRAAAHARRRIVHGTHAHAAILRACTVHVRYTYGTCTVHVHSRHACICERVYMCPRNRHIHIRRSPQLYRVSYRKSVSDLVVDKVARVHLARRVETLTEPDQASTLKNRPTVFHFARNKGYPPCPPLLARVLWRSNDESGERKREREGERGGGEKERERWRDLRYRNNDVYGSAAQRSNDRRCDR